MYVQNYKNSPYFANLLYPKNEELSKISFYLYHNFWFNGQF